MSLRAIGRWGSMADTSADEEGSVPNDPGGEASVPDLQRERASGLDERTRAQLGSPLLVGCIAYAILTWMILVAIVIYAWKLFGS